MPWRVVILEVPSKRDTHPHINYIRTESRHMIANERDWQSKRFEQQGDRQHREGGGASYWHQPNFEEIGLVDKRPFFTTLRAFSAHFYQAELQANWRQICLLVLGKSVRKMCQLHIQKINKVWICFGLFCSILHIHSNAYTCIDLYVYQ